MSAPKFPLLDPKDIFTIGVGFVLGIGILVFFVLLAMGLDMPLLVNHGNVPHQ